MLNYGGTKSEQYPKKQIIEQTKTETPSMRTIENTITEKISEV